MDDNTAFAKKNNLTYPLLCDTERALGMAYGACTDAKAKYASRVSILVGKDGKIEKLYPKVKPQEHAQQVLDDVAKPNK